MTRRQKQRFLFLLLSFCIALFVYSKDALLETFPELRELRFLQDKGDREVKGDTSLYQVMRVVDGDTIVVSRGDARETVRLIGINTPESVDPRRPVECFGKEAKEYLGRLLEQRKVRLEADPTQHERDRYGRLLRYVFIEDQTLINKKLIEEGYAYEYTYDMPYQYQTKFRMAQQEASSAGKGLWSESTCSGKK